jgi:O-antigen/teichoic acid export membrane protein
MDPINEINSSHSGQTPTPPPKSGLYQSAVRGGLWVIAMNWATKLLGVATLFVLTNILGSTKWGLLGIASLVISAVNVFTQTGFSAALIQKRDDARDCLDTAWTLELIRGIILCIVLWVAAPWAALFFDRDGRMEPGHLESPAVFLETLRESRDPLSAFVYSGLSPEVRAQAALITPDSAVSPELKEALCRDLNRLMEADGWEDPAVLAGARLSPYAQKLMRQSGIDPVRLHRRILQECYPQRIVEVVLDRDTIQWIIRILSLIQVIGAMINIGTLYFKKDMQFHRDFIFTTGSYLAETVATITLAFATRSIWSLVWGKLLGVILKCIASYILHPYRPRVRISGARLRELWNFGQWIFFAGMLAFFLGRGDQLFVGKMLGPAMLGLYVLASKFALVPATEISTVLTEVTFPAYSKIQDDLPRLRSAFLKVLQLTAFLSVPLAGLVFALSADFVRTFFRREWWPMIPLLQILVLRGMVFSIHTTFGSVFRAVGKPFITVYLLIARLILMAILLYPLIARWQVVGAAMAVVIIALVMQPVGYYIVMRILHCNARLMMKAVWVPFAATVGMVLAVYGLRQLACDGYYNLWTLGGLGAAGVSVYVLLMLAFEWIGLCQIRPLLTEIVQTVLRKRSSRPAEFQPIPPIDEP